MPASSVRYLGIYIDSDASMKMHISRTVSSCVAVLRQIRSIRRSVSQQTLQSLVVSLVQRRLDYGKCDVCRRGKQSTRQTHMFSTEVQPNHTAASGPSLVTSAKVDRVQASGARLPLLAGYVSAIPHTRTAPCARHGLSTATSFHFNVRAEHSTNASCHSR